MKRLADERLAGGTDPGAGALRRLLTQGTNEYREKSNGGGSLPEARLKAEVFAEVEALVLDAKGERALRALAVQSPEFLELPADDANLAHQVGEILDVLDDLGLIEPARGC